MIFLELHFYYTLLPFSEDLLQFVLRDHCFAQAPPLLISPDKPTSL